MNVISNQLEMKLFHFYQTQSLRAFCGENRIAARLERRNVLLMSNVSSCCFVDNTLNCDDTNICIETTVK